MLLLRFLDILPHLFAQSGSEAAANMVIDSLNLQQQIRASWDDIWKSALDWQSADSPYLLLVKLSSTLAFFILIYLFIKKGEEISKSKYLGSVIEMFMMPLVYIIFVGTNGKLLAQIILTLRGVAESEIERLNQIKIGGIQISNATLQVQTNILGQERIRQVYSECQGAIGEDLTKCLQSKQSEAQGIVNGLEQQLPDNVSLEPLQNFADTIGGITGVSSVAETAGNLVQGNFIEIIQNQLYPILKNLLYATQWAFINMVEAALVLTAVIAPLALVFSLLPTSGKPIWAWASGFISLYGLKLFYSIIVGIIATVIVNTDGSLAELGSEFGFLIFLSLLAPFISTALVSWGGVSLYQGIQSRATAILGAALDGVGSMGKMMMGK